MHLTHRVEMKSSRLNISPFITNQHSPRTLNDVYRFIMHFVKMGLDFCSFTQSYYKNSNRIVFCDFDPLSFFASLQGIVFKNLVYLGNNL